MTQNIGTEFNSWQQAQGVYGYGTAGLTQNQSEVVESNIVGNPYDSIPFDDHTLQPNQNYLQRRLIAVMEQMIQMLAVLVRFVIQKIGGQTTPANGSETQTSAPTGVTAPQNTPPTPEESSAAGENTSTAETDKNPNSEKVTPENTVPPAQTGTETPVVAETKEENGKEAVKDSPFRDNPLLNRVFGAVQNFVNNLSEIFSPEKIDNAASTVKGWIEKGLDILNKVSGTVSKIAEVVGSVASIFLKGPKFLKNIFKSFGKIFKHGGKIFKKVFHAGKSIFKGAKKFFKKIF